MRKGEGETESVRPDGESYEKEWRGAFDSAHCSDLIHNHTSE